MRTTARLTSLIMICGLVLGCASMSRNGGSQPARTAVEPTPTRTASVHTVAVLKRIPLAKPESVREAVRDECQLQTKVPKFIEAFAPEYGLEVQLVDSLDRTSLDRILHVTITEVHAPGGGAWSGAKWMRIEGRLAENGRTVAEFEGRRISSGGMFAGFKGTCSIIGRCTEALGKDVARWLQNPTDGARIGDLN